MDFKKAYEIYTSPNVNIVEVEEVIQTLKDGMNIKIIDYTMPKDYKPIITPYWLLGFVEGEGSFSVGAGPNYHPTFNITQASTDLVVMEAIKVFLDDLRSEKDKLNESFVYLRFNTPANTKPITRVVVNQSEFLLKVIIPFFEGLTWRSKKESDFKDWVIILQLKERYFQYKENGIEIIELIISQMNNRRLSTNNTQKVDRDLLDKLIAKLFNEPSNFEIKNGKFWIKSLNKFKLGGNFVKPAPIQLIDYNGTVLVTFLTQKECAEHLGKTPLTIARWIKIN